MVRIPGLDLVNSDGTHPFGGFCSTSPILDDVKNGSIRSIENFYCDLAEKQGSIITLTQAGDLENSKAVTLVIYSKIQDLDDELADILLEVDIVRGLNHKNVLKFLEIASGPKITDVALVFEPFHSVMTTFMQAEIDKIYDPPVIKTIMRDLYTALAYLHTNGIIHRDIQPENILFSFSGALKIWNFRNAMISGLKPRKLKTYEFRYQSPELLLGNIDFFESVDVWSANCIFAHLLLKKPLFPKNEKEVVLQGIFKLLGFPVKEVWEEFFDLPFIQDLKIFSAHKYNMLDRYFKKHCDSEISPLAMNLIHKCFRYDPEIRLIPELCLRHPYFSEEPKACPVKEIFQLMEEAAICQNIRRMKEKKRV